MFSPPVKAKKTGQPLEALGENAPEQGSGEERESGCSYRLRSCWNRTLMPLEFSTVRPKLRSST